jgi:single-strand DNA-binding protein
MNNKAKNKPEWKAAPFYQNHVRLVGFLGSDPERHENRTVLSLATQASWKDKKSDDWKEHTEWHRVTAWRDLAEAVATLAKGDHVLVEGDLRSSSYVTEATTVKAWEIRARLVRKLATRKVTKPAKAKA